MIDCLSNPCWINPQTDFLLFLQQYRVGSLEMLDKIFLSITIFGEYWLPTLICAIVYWCIDFRAGMYLFSLEGTNIIISHILKMIACVYRPWILNDKIHPSELAIPYAKGYSFPSGHSSMSSSVIGGLAYLLRKRLPLCIMLICLIMLIGFSRLWLGVHTPQDVIGGFTIGIVLIFVVNKILNWADEKKNRYLYLAVVINVLTLLSLLYICKYNNYRMDYINGVLLVNPVKSIYLTCMISGFGLGIINGSFLCRRFFPFEPKEGSIIRRTIRGVIGSICIVSLLRYIFNYLIVNVLSVKYTMLLTFITGISITFLYPVIFVNFEKFYLKISQKK